MSTLDELTCRQLDRLEDICSRVLQSAEAVIAKICNVVSGYVGFQVDTAAYDCQSWCSK